MTKFIKVNEQYREGVTHLLIINCDHIRTIKTGDRGKDTMIYLTEDKYFFVKESVDEIWMMINCDMTKPPIIMSADEYSKYIQAQNRYASAMEVTDGLE